MVLFGGIGSYYVFFGRAETDFIMAAKEAETFTLPQSTGIVNDVSASGGKAVIFYSNGGTASGTMSASAPVTKIQVRAKSKDCRGSAQMALSANGREVSRITLTSTSWADYTTAVSLPAGSHTVGISFTNDYGWKKCNRDLFIDKVSFIGTTTTPPPAPTSDTIAPTVSLTTPTSGAAVTGTINANANASDNVSVAKVDFLIDGAVKASGPNQSFSFNTAEVLNGTHSLQARAYDAAGNVGSSGVVQVNVNNTSAALLIETFDGPNGLFASEGDFYGSSDLGASKSPVWAATSGSINRENNTGRSTFSNWAFRMYTRKTDYSFTKLAVDVKFNGWFGGSGGWQGVNLWLNQELKVPDDGSRINDANGNSAYLVDFMNRDGSFLIMKKDNLPQPAGSYYELAVTRWTPNPGQTYHLEGRTIKNSNGSVTIEVYIDGVLKLRGVDDASRGGPILTGGRVGVRGDYADFTIDNLTITR